MKTLCFWLGSAALGALSLSACGGRSQLRDFAGNGSGGSGGSGGFGGTTSSATTTGASTTSGGSSSTGGVLKGPCSELTYATPFASIAGGEQVHQRSPRLTYSSDDGASVTVATGWQVASGQNPPTEMRHTSFAPWGNFPAGAALGPTYLADLDGGGSFAVASGNGGKFALLFRDFQQPPSGGLRFSDQLTPGSGAIPPSLLVDSSARTALFLARGQTTFSFGAAFRQGETREIRAGILDGNGVVETTLGCANGPVVADALPVGDASVFVAYSTGTEALSGGCDAGVPGPPNRIQLAQIIGGVLSSVGEVTVSPMGGTAEITGPVTDISFAPRTDGAWMVWSNPGSDFASPSLVVCKLTTPVGQLDLMAEAVVPYQPGSLAVASFDDYLMVAWIQPEPGGASPHVQVFDPKGKPLGDIQVAATGAVQGRLALLGSPFDHSAALAWSETGSGPNAADQVRLTRITCIDKK